MPGFGEEAFELETGEGYEKWSQGGGAGDPGFGGGGGPTELVELIAQLFSAGGPEGYGPRRRRTGIAAMPAERVPIPRYQYGTRYHPGGRAVVGEAGPEVVNLPRGAAVQPTAAAGGPLGGFRRSPLGAPRLPSRGGVSTVPGGPGRISERPGGPGEFGIDIGAFYGPNGQVSIPQLLQIMTAQGIRSGTFDPLGSQQFAEMARNAIQGQLGARERAATLGADLDAGNDPALRAYGRLGARLGTQQQASQAYLDAILESARRNQEFLQSLFAGPIAGAATRRDPRDPNAMAQIGGDIGGTLLGSFLGGRGTRVPTRRGAGI